jgi:hypothetical protein
VTSHSELFSKLKAEYEIVLNEGGGKGRHWPVEFREKVLTVYDEVKNYSFMERETGISKDSIRSWVINRGTNRVVRHKKFFEVPIAEKSRGAILIGLTGVRVEGLKAFEIGEFIRNRIL